MNTAIKSHLVVALVMSFVLGQDLQNPHVKLDARQYTLDGLQFKMDLPGAILNYDHYISPGDSTSGLNYFLHTALWVGTKRGDRISVVSGDGNPTVKEFPEWKFVEFANTTSEDPLPPDIASVSKSMYSDDLLLPGHQPVGLTVAQRTFEFAYLPVLIFEYTIEPETSLDSVIVGLLFDFDLPEEDHTSTPYNDHIRVYPEHKLIAMSNAGNWADGYIPGVLMLSNDEFRYRVLGSLSAPLSDKEKWQVLTQPSSETTFNETTDYRFVVAADSRPLSPGDSLTFIVALVHTRTLETFTHAQRNIKAFDLDHPRLFKQSSPRRLEIAELPAEISLSPNYPNPFNPSTTIKVSLPEDMSVQLNVYDIRGRLVKSLYHGNLVGGIYSFSWNGTDDHGGQMSSGIYLLELRSTSFRQTQKMVYLR